MRAFVFINQQSFAKNIMVDIAHALERLGWQIHWADIDDLIKKNRHKAPDERRRLVHDFLREVEDFDPHIIFSYGLEYCNPVFRELLPEMTSPLFDLIDRPAVFFLFDFGSPFKGSLTDSMASLCRRLQDSRYLFFCWDREAMGVMERHGFSKVFYFPMAVDENVFYQTPQTPEDQARYGANIAFIGGPTEKRIEHLEAISGQGLKIYGYDEKAWGASSALRNCYSGVVYERDELRKIYNGAKISVNVTRQHGFSSLNMRVYEAMACGSLMMTDDKADARELFEEGRELVIYRNKEELRKKVGYYMAHEDERQAIAAAGRKRVLELHTYVTRLRESFPMIRDFYRESLLFDEADRFIARDPEKGLRFLRFEQTREKIQQNNDNYYYYLATLHGHLGNKEEARSCLAAALDANRDHLAGLALEREWKDRAEGH